MKTTLFRFGRTAACLTLAVALLTGCSLLPAASPRKDPIPVEQPSDASAALDDGKLRILYDSNGSTVLCGSKVLHEGRGDETVALVYDPAERYPLLLGGLVRQQLPLRPPQRPLR